METVTRHVRDIDANERLALERVLGQPLHDNQQVIIQVVADNGPAKDDNHQAVPFPDRLPEWCNVYAGLTDKQIAEVEEVILQRADLSRPSE